MSTNKVGVMLPVRKNTDIFEEFEKIAAMDMNCCQVNVNSALHSDELAEAIVKASNLTDVEVTAVWAGLDGVHEWNSYGGPSTIGIVPAAYRDNRMKQLYAASDFALKLGVTDIITHVGFIPENPYDPDFIGVVTALRGLANYMKPRGQYFLFETGQETPVTILRTIEEIGTDNLGINLDTANLILYGKGNPLDSLDVFGKYVRNTHCKDGFYPTTGRELGIEVALGQGKVDFPNIIKKLKELDYTGAYVIEREISGQQQIIDIIAARDYIKSLL
jgi:Sugar phosphate isomerases/epimerases